MELDLLICPKNDRMFNSHSFPRFSIFMAEKKVTKKIAKKVTTKAKNNNFINQKLKKSMTSLVMEEL